ncbi:MAG: response regulator transcription factor [Planctomycetota bacterium]|nr:response regulator transcription factor [Planctomycetota bacterium]
MSIRVFVIDNHAVVRRGFQSILNHAQFQWAGEAGTIQQAVHCLNSTLVDLIILDVSLQNENGLNSIGKLKSLQPSAAILIVSAYDNPNYVSRAISLGASGYALKDAPISILLEAIQNASSGQSTWTREELRRVTGALATPRLDSDLEVPLTQRENQVLQQITLGQSNKRIAQQLEISYETAKEHVQHILKKIGVDDRTQAATWAVRKGLF